MIRKATEEDTAALVSLANSLWPHASADELKDEFQELTCNPRCACFLCFREGTPIGFAQCQLRQDYVEGTESSPVGYLEGIYVVPSWRGRGYGSALLAACEAWAKSMDCREFASDCEITNDQSLAFHLKMGFREANRIVCFAKGL